MNNMYDLCLCVFFFRFRFIALVFGTLVSTNKNKIAPKDIVIFSHYSWQNPLITTLI